MSAVTHHIPDNLLIAYAAGTLPRHFALVVAAHVSMCDQSRAALAAHQAAGGAVMEGLEGIEVSPDLLGRVMAGLDAPEPRRAAPQSAGIYPAPVVEAMGGPKPRWRPMGLGTKQQILHADDAGSVRLLYIPGGQAVPDHSHRGLELTLVLQGAFEDEEGRFGVGDVEVADDEVDHTPIAAPGEPCICLAATEGKLRFRGMMPKLLQPLFRI